ncbi:DUF5615 family PIN-like protein [Sphingomonas mollis]|uniref:DUF5615 family PIN-like protein n=1 Tax=Sphingomonas mollis TaxID=2795726 RepID=A0ABS0XU83_9SPHN|nr:DUF5615 family PIN-like protein [Sphingomonas sp. BT553]
MKLFIDECLSSELVQRAIVRGHPDTSSVVYRGLAGTKDWNLVPILVAEDLTLVTRNAIDFQGRADAPGEKGLYKDVELHAGLICLTAPVMDLDTQIELFEVALDELDLLGHDLVNTCLEVMLDAEERIIVTRYELPKV